MEYLKKNCFLTDEQVFPNKDGESGILHGWDMLQPIFAIVHKVGVDEETGDVLFHVLAKCADKFLAHSIREACEARLDKEAEETAYATEQEEGGRTLQGEAMGGQSCLWNVYCLKWDCLHTGSCPHYHPYP